MNWKQIQQQLATEFNLPLPVVQIETNAYWTLIRKRLSTPTEHMVRIEGFGSFRINESRLFKLLAHYLINLQRIKHGFMPQKQINGINAEARLHVPVLWKLKQKLQWRNTSKKPGPKKFVLTRYAE